jgi:hypothetical protein
MGRSWCESWVCGEGQVDRAGSTTSHEDESCWRALPRRLPCEMPMAGNVIGRGPGVECLRGTKPETGGAVMAGGAECPIERETVAPCEDILLSRPKD